VCAAITTPQETTDQDSAMLGDDEDTAKHQQVKPRSLLWLHKSILSRWSVSHIGCPCIQLPSSRTAQAAAATSHRSWITHVHHPRPQHLTPLCPLRCVQPGGSKTSSTAPTKRRSLGKQLKNFASGGQVDKAERLAADNLRLQKVRCQGMFQALQRRQFVLHATRSGSKALALEGCFACGGRCPGS
jgi:hypothetical protein